MIIIKDEQSESEEDQYIKEVTQNTKEKEYAAIWRKIRISKGVVFAMIAVLLTAVSVLLAYNNYSLTQQIQVESKVHDQMLIIEDKVLQYQPSHNLIPPAKTVQQDLVKNTEIYQFESILRHYLMPYTDTNCILKRYGRKADGGYVLCQNFVKYSKALLNFGIKDDDSFGCQLITSHKIANYQFDCTQQSPKKCNGNDVRPNLLCLGDVDELINGKEYTSLGTISERFRLKQSRLIVKMDIEGDEWASLSHLQTELLGRIDQLIVQFHLNKPEKSMSWHYVGIIKAILAKFVPVNLHMNNFGCFGLFRKLHSLQSDSFQVTFVNREHIQFHSYQRSYKQSKENEVNEPSKIDCQPS